MHLRTRVSGHRHAAAFSSAALAVGLVASVATAPPANASAIKSDLHKLRICESGDNYHEDSGNGYYGAYQFSSSTWTYLGFRGRPDQAKPKTQNRAAKRLHHTAGWTAWPACSKTEHLSG